jgi:NAD(P)-dependent dehydrogenase (short-subunit alcohol dehydrogenase family)
LAGVGARIVLVARDRERGEHMLARLRELAPNAAHSAHYGDLSLMAEVKRVGAEIAAAEPRVDVLVNNAGNVFATRKVTAEGLERTFALNHMAYFVLTHCLRERLLASAPARVVSTASSAHQRQELDLDDLQLLRGYGLLKAYDRSKLCNILFTRELARRLAGTGVTANCVHPGFVVTNLGQRGGGVFKYLVRASMVVAGRPDKGARTIAYLAGSPDVADVSGGYFYNCRQIEPSRAAKDDATAQCLWRESEKLAGFA